MIRPGLLAFALGTSTLTVGCGAAAPKESRSPSQKSEASEDAPSSQSGYGQQPYSQGQPGAYPQQPGTAAQPAPAAAPEATGGGASGEAQRFASYEHKLDVSSGSRDETCKALASMDRSCGVLCTLENGRRCEDARDRVRAARKRVRTAFGTCPDGTPTDPSAPIPSR